MADPRVSTSVRIRAGWRVCTGTAMVAMLVASGGCAPEVGSDRWCTMMRDTPRGDWSANDALDFARHCVIE